MPETWSRADRRTEGLAEAPLENTRENANWHCRESSSNSKPKIPEQLKEIGGMGLGETCEMLVSCHDYDDARGACVEFDTETNSSKHCAKVFIGTVGSESCNASSLSYELPDPVTQEKCDLLTSKCGKNTCKCEAITLVDVGQKCNSHDTFCKLEAECGFSTRKCEPQAANGEACQYTDDCLSDTCCMGRTCEKKVSIYDIPNFLTFRYGDKK